jgi:two-component system, CAI-1 autoinducer sensor kinase/phosphatase CqsS
MQKNWKLLTKIDNGIKESFYNSQPNFITLGLLFIIGFGSFYIFNMFVVKTEIYLYESLNMRIAVIFFGFTLLIFKYLPHSIHKYFQYYWIISLTFSLPIFFTFMLLMNQQSIIWYVNGLLSIVILTLFVNWVLFFLMILIGSCIGSFLYYINMDSFIVNDVTLSVLPSYVGSILFFLFLMNKKSKLDNEKIKLLQSSSQTLAHEIRTPLATISNHCYIINDKLNKNQKPDVINNIQTIENTVNNISIFLDIFLRKTNDFTNIKCSNILVNPLINEISSNMKSIYDFGKENILIDVKQSIKVYADYTLLTHILYNILQNSINSLKTKGGGNIEIKAFLQDKNTYIVIKDNGCGISKKNISQVFNLFFTTSEYGNGLGLYFCKNAMESMGGSISCKSVEGEYTEFVLKFPKVEEELITSSISNICKL